MLTLIVVPTSEPTIDCVRALDDADLAIVARLLASALETDPAYRYLMQSAGLEDFFVGNLRTHLPYRCTHLAFDNRGGLLATVTVRPPGGVHPSLLTLLRRGLVPFARKYGLGATRRLFWLKSRYDVLEAEAASGSPHHHVHMMAVDPRWQGRGLGGQLLAHVLAQVSGDGLPAVLTTHREENVTFYRRAGFEVCKAQDLSPPGGERFRVWSMLRRPASTAQREHVG